MKNWKVHTKMILRKKWLLLVKLKEKDLKRNNSKSDFMNKNGKQRKENPKMRGGQSSCNWHEYTQKDFKYTQKTKAKGACKDTIKTSFSKYKPSISEYLLATFSIIPIKNRNYNVKKHITCIDFMLKSNTSE